MSHSKWNGKGKIENKNWKELKCEKKNSVMNNYRYIIEMENNNKKNIKSKVFKMTYFNRSFVTA